jgi:lipopolysaccharide transport system permease protein
MIPHKWRFLYSLNPMAGVIEGFRWALLGTQRPDFRVIAMSALVVLVLLLPALVYFRYTERTFADIV